MLELSWGGKIYVFVSVTFLVLAFAHLILMLRMVWALEKLMKMIENGGM